MSAGLTATLVRPMADADIPQVAAVTAEAFATNINTPVLRRNWEQRLRHSLLTDPDGSFVSEHNGVITGAAQAVIREGIWILSLMAVSPTLGAGRRGPGADGGHARLRPGLRDRADHRLRRSTGAAPVRLVRLRARAHLPGHGQGRSRA